jgi:hypothetical protein
MRSDAKVPHIIDTLQQGICKCVESHELGAFHDDEEQATLVINSLKESLCQLVIKTIQRHTLLLEPREERPRVCRIHVSQPAIRKNLKEIRENAGDGYNPVITCKRGTDNVYGHKVEILDKSGTEVVAVVTQPRDKQLSCGARVWVETHNPVLVSEDQGHVTLQTKLPR